ncbi:MAG: hypothetical protein H6718_09540 [Polyangiaceae bacterium]|nr:hypothetical protein [Myxococcales bacterium]MCB9585630.1 hypothetical protein [Polyangiaceae bacterium]MCB9606354.1 hypothetical protein [Polyangiaceae bacterium]
MKSRSRGEIKREVRVGHLWSGEALAVDAVVDFTLDHASDLLVTIDAPLWPDPPPAFPPGRVPELWRYSVAELFIWGGEERYLELEVGPFGHWWLLELLTWRERCREDLPCDVTVERGSSRWRAEVRIAEALLPPRPWRLGACAIWGGPDGRSYAMSHPSRGAAPNFHQASAFAPAW